MPNERNPVVRSGTILRKGGAHTQSVSGQRHQSKRQLYDEIDEYFNEDREKPRSNLTRSGKRAIHKKRGGSKPSLFFITSIIALIL